jgi:hypothetical protein
VRIKESQRRGSNIFVKFGSIHAISIDVGLRIIIDRVVEQ